MDILVEDLFDAYEARIRKLDWMSPPTKRKAIQKLRAMNPKIGYPKKYRTYRGLKIRKNDLVGNVMRTNEYEHRRMIQKLGKPVNRDEWFMTPQTVNAYYAPTLNDIVFPAGILQHPFFDAEADDAINYGAIGWTIGHEMTHGFDDEGSKFDYQGNRKEWWTKKDRHAFEKKTRVLIKQFNEYTVADGVHINGKLTLGENIADLGGLAIAFDAYQNRLRKTGRIDIDGFTPEQRFFLGYAQGDREVAREAYLKMAVATDPHSPAEFRINGPASNMKEFYAVFLVEKGDKLYRSQKDRAEIW
jgi:putative endopeptidase